MKVLLNKRLIIIIILLAIVVAFFSINNYIKNQEKIRNKERTDKFLNIMGIGVFFEKSDGIISSSEVSKFLNNNVIEFLPTMFSKVKNYSNENLKKYFESNRNNIKENLGITSFEDFSIFIQKLREKKISLNTGEKIEIIRDSFDLDSDKNGYSYVEYEVTYSNENKIYFSLYIKKNDDNMPSYIIDVIK